MLKILLLSTLLTAVYSWEEIKHTLLMLVRYFLRKQNKIRFYRGRTDKLVGSLIMIASVPLGLSFFAASQSELIPKLLGLSIFLVAGSALAAGAATALGRLRFSAGVAGQEKALAVAYSALGLISPIFGMFRGQGRQDQKMLAKFALLLSLPPIAGAFLKFETKTSPEILIPNTDALITILVLSLFLRIGVDFLEKYFKTAKLKTLFSYYRVVLGIVLSAILLLD